MQKQPGRVTLRDMNTKVVAPIALSVGLLGIVGGVAATQAFQPVAKPKTQVQLVQPAAQTVTVTPSPTTTTAVPVKTTTAPKPVATTTAPKPVPVQSTQAAPRTVQKAAVVSTDTSTTSAPATSSSSAAPAPSPLPPACPIGSTKPGCGNNPGTPSPTSH